MPSPFPGMDPYLESPEFFPDLHDSLIVAAKADLQASLPPAYYVQVASRVWVEYSERTFKPDVNLVRSNGGAKASLAGSGAVAVDVEPVKVVVASEEIRQTFLEIRTVQGGRRLVTSIEVLSPSNKTPGDHGRTLYQKEVLSSQANLVEIDLLRGGTHTVAVPRDPELEQVGPFDYQVCIRRFDDLKHYYVHPIRLDQKLPAIHVPLLPEDAPARLDLQGVFDRCYDMGAYRKLDIYRTTRPVPPLTAPQEAWAQKMLKDQGLV